MSEWHNGWRTSDGFEISEEFQKCATSKSLDFSPSTEILNENFLFPLIELLWLELAELELIEFTYQPDAVDGDSFIGSEKGKESIFSYIDDWLQLVPYFPDLDESPWLSINYSIDTEEVQNLLNSGELESELSNLSEGSSEWQFLNNPIGTPVDQSILDLFIDAAQYQSAPLVYAVEILVKPIKGEVTKRLESQAWRWATLSEEKKRIITKAIIDSKNEDGDQLGLYLGYLISIHPSTPEDLKAWLAIEIEVPQ